MAAGIATKAAARAERTVAPADVPILASKITVPGAPDWVVHRPRIAGLIAQGARWCQLTVVTGPPGAGKTTALALWAAAEAGAVAWVSVDEFGNRPGIFWSYVVAALRRSGVVIPGELPAFVPGPVADHVFLLRLATALAAQDPPVTLVVDDLDLLTDAAVADGLDLVLRSVGPGLSLVVSSRADPLLPLHRYRLAGELAEVRASDLAFSIDEAGQLMAQHGLSLPADSLALLTRRTEGWAAGLRLAAISMGAHPRPDRFVKELITENSALTGYLVEEVLNSQRPEAREVLLSTSILEPVSAEAASELAGTKQAGRILSALARANMFVQPIGPGRYRYHPLFAEVLRLKLRREHPDRMAVLHRRAARWHERKGLLVQAVRHAAEAGDWQLAASMVVDGLAIGEIIKPLGSPSLADEFRRVPPSGAWTGPQPYLVCAAVELSAGRPGPALAALDAADGMLECLPGDQETASRLAAALLHLAAARRAGDLRAATVAADRAQVMVGLVPGDKLAQRPGIRARVLADRGAVALWSGHLDEAAQVLDMGVAAATAWGTESERADCLGHLALAEAARGRLSRAAGLAAQAASAPTSGGHRSAAPHPNAAALVALAWVHTERNELREARSRLKQADAALDVSPDKLTGVVACLVAAYGRLAEGREVVAAQFVARARSGCAVPVWLDDKLSLAELRAYTAAGDIRAGLAAAEQVGRDDSLETAVTFAQAWMAAGDPDEARRALAPALATPNAAPERVQLQAWLVDARLSYDNGDQERGRRSLASALRLAEPEQLRLPIAVERGWIEPVLRRDPRLAHTYLRLFGATLRRSQLVAPVDSLDETASLMVEPLSGREREVLLHLSDLLDTTEIASEMCISINTVKSHLKSIYRKLSAKRRGEAVRRARQLGLI
jgi:LuxR family transcriptional regulator, maltose regulon positive regulatory protein